MVKLVFCLRRRPELSAEEFHRYWREEHAPLVRAALPALGAVRYVQVRTVADERLNAALRRPRGGPEPFDGIAEVWWPDRATFDASPATPEAREAALRLIEDERRFIDFSASPIWLAYEDVIIPGSGLQP
jgi:uncharacterized protein (TIGR02118 family)